MASSNSHRPARRAAVAGAMALGAMILPAAPAMAEPFNIPGVGTFDVPAVPNLPIPQFPGTPGAPFAPPAPVFSAGQRAVEAAQSKLGAPYVYGAAGPNAFDCSGLVQWAFAQAGIGLPRTSGAQAGVGVPVSLSDLQVGDVIIYNGGGHAGIYAGDGNIIHASTSGTPVRYAPLNSMAIYAVRRV